MSPGKYISVSISNWNARIKIYMPASVKANQKSLLQTAVKSLFQIIHVYVPHWLSQCRFKDQKLNSNSRKELLYEYSSSKPKYFAPNIVKEFQIESIRMEQLQTKTYLVRTQNLWSAKACQEIPEEEADILEQFLALPS